MPLTGTKRQNGPSQVSDDSIFEILPYLSCIIDKSTTRVVRANRLFNEKVGKGFLSSLFFADDLINKDDRRHFIESLGENTTVKNLKTLNFIGADDFPVHVAHDWKVTPIPGVDQVLLMGSQCVEKDDVCLTDALSDQEELIDFLQNAPIAMHWLSGNGTILWANNTELKALGYTKEEYIGHSIMEFCPEEADAVGAVFARLLNGETVQNAPFKFRAKNGAPVYLSVDSNANFNEDGTFRHTRCFIKNDQERRIADAVQTAKLERSKLLSNAKSHFVRRVFHIIQTPIHIAYNTLLETYGTENSKNPCVVNLEKLLSKVEEMGFVTTFENSQVLPILPEHMNLNEALHGVIQKVLLDEDACSSAKASRDGESPANVSVHIAPDVPPIVSVDPRLDRVLYNLCSNAVRYRVAPKVDIVIRTSTTTTAAAATTATASSASPQSPQSALRVGESGSRLVFEFSNKVSSSVTVKAIYSHFYQYFQSDLSIVAKGGESVSGEGEIKEMEEEEAQTSIESDLSSDSDTMGIGICYSSQMVEVLGGQLHLSVEKSGEGNNSSSNHDLITFSFSIPIEIPPTPLEQPHRMEKDSNEKQEILSQILPIEACHGAGLHMELSEGKQQQQQAKACGGGGGGDDKKEAASLCGGVQLHVLVVDDSVMCQKVLARSLTKASISVDLAWNGEEAVQKLTEVEPCRYDAVLMDLRMPIMDGITATRICKEKHEHLKEIPFIIVTAELGEEVRQAAQAASATAFINKPAKIDQILKLLKMHTHGRGL